MPKLRHLFPDYADDDRFWSKPLATRALPGPVSTPTMPEMVSAK
jgi:hypothetical protein